MNERIFELAEQAEEYAITRHPVSNIALSVNSENFVKKFAELIVRECMSMCDVAQVGYLTHGHTLQGEGCQGAKQYIADWFEVEE